MMFRFVVASVWMAAIATAAASSTSRSSRLAFIPRGGDYASECESVKCSIIEKAASEIEELRRSIVDAGKIVEGFGAKADSICNQALEDFALNAPSEEGGDETTYDSKLEELEAALDAPLLVLYLKQLALLREQALQRYRDGSSGSGSETSDYEAMLLADSQFQREAEDSTREGGDSGSWNYAGERSHLQTVMNDLGLQKKRVVEVQIKSQQQYSTAMQYLQQQQQMIQQLQMQLYGQTTPWNAGVAYRIPDTNFNLQGTYQQGRANVQLSCVPDEYAPLLGPQGFTNGVGPGNLGLSLNLSI